LIPGSDDLAEALAALESAHRRRTRRVLDSPQGAHVRESGQDLVNFASNDYLGLANDPRLRTAAYRSIDEFGVGAGASPLVVGHMRIHEDAEAAFARFVKLPRALLFSSGYAANLGILATLGAGDAEIIGDRLNHACLNDGAILSRARFTRYPHIDLAALEKRLANATAPMRIVATDAVFSMDGDIAPLPEMAEICERYDAWLVIDDAHGIGVLGDGGRGSLDHFKLRSRRIVYMATLGKALGGYGAFVAGDEELVEWLLQRAHTYMFSTALPPMVAGVAWAAIDALAADPALVERLRTRIREFREACEAEGLELGESTTAIQPLLIGPDDRAVEIAAQLRGHGPGYLVPAIRPPTVPEGTARLRISLSAAHTREDVEGLAQALAFALA
jgi:8-amino-7-oxononanoate synthase